MRRSIAPVIVVGVAFALGCVGLFLTSLSESGEARHAVNAFRAAVTGLATGLVSVASLMLGRNHDDSDVRCPLCEGRFPEDDRFKAHECARTASPPGELGGHEI